LSAFRNTSIDVAGSLDGTLGIPNVVFRTWPEGMDAAWPDPEIFPQHGFVFFPVDSQRGSPAAIRQMASWNAHHFVR